VIDTGKGGSGGGSGVDVSKLLALNEQAKHILGIDFLAKIDAMGKPSAAAPEAEEVSMLKTVRSPENETPVVEEKVIPPAVTPPPKPPKRAFDPGS
jgi:hypothetical protein